MSFVNSIITDLRNKRLWPVALALVAALVAVPVLLTGKSSSAPADPAPAAPAAAQGGTAMAGLSVSSHAAKVRLKGRGRDPFAPQGHGGANTMTASSGSTSGGQSTPPGGGAVGSGGRTSSASSAGGTGSSSGDTSPSGATGTTTPSSATGTGSGSGDPTPAPQPAARGLEPDESYDVSVGITNQAGGLDTLDPLERLSPLPGNQRPLLLELGVLEGGRRVLFVVRPGAVLAGPGACIPAAADCQILSLAPRQTEKLSARSAKGEVGEVAELAVTAIRVDRHTSAAAAARTRRMTSAFGRGLLADSSSLFLPLFPYEPSLGAVVDGRTLSVQRS